MDAKRMRTSRQQLIEEPATLADRTANGAGAQCERVPTLEEAAKLLEREAGELDGLVDDVAHHLRSKAKTIRVLSSPDHADAGKVEGDGWRPIESAPKDETLFLAYCPADEDFPDGRMMIWKGSIFAFQKNPTPNHLQFPATHWRPLPSAPSQEVA